MIQLECVQKPGLPPTNMSSVAAKACYSANLPPLDSMMNVKGQLFDTGHHTTFQHSNYTFVIWNIAVGDITLGLHLCSPFYDTDQRSGRYCGEMFLIPNYIDLARYVRALWPELDDGTIWGVVIPYIRHSLELFAKYGAESVGLAEHYLRKTRSRFPEKGIAVQADKIAQEQRRVLVSVIMPTALYYTVNLSAISALYKSAFTPSMRALTSMMADEVINHDPGVAFMFKREDDQDWTPELVVPWSGVRLEPKLELLELSRPDTFNMPDDKFKHPVDQLHFRPEFMDNGIGGIVTRKTLSLMTMGQDQRHRTLRRGAPEFTGEFYVPPLIAKCKGASKDADVLQASWLSLREQLPGTLWAVLAPYGAMVTYRSAGDFNAVAHEQAKRLCWNAQEEIRNLARQLRSQMVDEVGADNKLVTMLEPPCFHGKCIEGNRYCGRPLKTRRDERYFARQVI